MCFMKAPTCDSNVQLRFLTTIIINMSQLIGRRFLKWPFQEVNQTKYFLEQ